MSERIGQLLGRVRLSFRGERGAVVPEDLSAVARQRDGTLWMAADERAALDSLRPAEPFAHDFAGHRHVALARALGLAEDAEIDIEGIDVEGGDAALWIVGSHSAKRKRPKRGDDQEDLARLATVETEPSRFVLARFPLSKSGLELDEPALLAPADDDARSLADLLEADEHLATFLPHREPAPIPGKDNGLDIEGLALREGRVLVGLRGPVLRGWAMVLELALEPRGERLEAHSIGKRAYRKHVLDLDGLGVRELMVHGDDVLIVAGPTMALDGAHRVFRWRPAKGRGDALVRQEARALEPLFDLPTTIGGDRAEGACSFDWFDEGDSMLVVYDTPSRARRVGNGSALADVFAIA